MHKDTNFPEFLPGAYPHMHGFTHITHSLMDNGAQDAELPPLASYALPWPSAMADILKSRFLSAAMQ
jgi:hypothetical protein